MGYDYVFSIDIDEYLMPLEEEVTIMDAMDKHVNVYMKSIVDIPRIYFQVCSSFNI